jgi:hypothetical protein
MKGSGQVAQRGFKPHLFLKQRKVSTIVNQRSPLGQEEEMCKSPNDSMQSSLQVSIVRYNAMTSRTSRPPKGGAISRKRITLADNNNSLSNSRESCKTMSRNLTRQKSKLLRSFISTKGIKKDDDSKNYQPFEPSLCEKPISPSQFEACRNSGAIPAGNSN